MFDWFVLLIPIFPLLAAIANGLLGSRYSHHTAARLACGLRTVERKVDLIRKAWSAEGSP